MAAAARILSPLSAHTAAAPPAGRRCHRLPSRCSISYGLISCHLDARGGRERGPLSRLDQSGQETRLFGPDGGRGIVPAGPGDALLCLTRQGAAGCFRCYRKLRGMWGICERVSCEIFEGGAGGNEASLNSSLIYAPAVRRNDKIVVAVGDDGRARFKLCLSSTQRDSFRRPTRWKRNKLQRYVNMFS